MNRFRVLLVEDNPGDARLVHEFLADCGETQWEDVRVARLREALHELASHRFDAVLLDLGLPDAEGLEAVRTVCRDFPEVPVVVLTGTDDAETGVQAVHAGAQDHVSKSRVDGEQLVRALRYAIERRQLQAAYDESQRLHREILKNSLGLICTHDMEGVVLSLNPAAAQAVGYAEEELVGRSLEDALAPAVRAEFGGYLERIRSKGEDTGLMRVVTRSGAERVWSYRNVRYDPSGSPPYVIGHALDVTALVEYEHQLREQGMRDPLTGCFNRRFLEKYESEAGDERWGCVFVDVDDMKLINDTHGHAAGDDVLIQMGRFLLCHLRPGDRVIRMGGDEFLVLLPRVDEPIVQSVFDRLRAQVVAKAPASFSLGLAMREAGEPLARTIERADQQMLLVKMEGRFARPRRRQTMAGAS